MQSFSQKKYQNKQKNGFTLVEVIVALGIFLTVVTLSMSSLLDILDANRKAQTMRATMDNLNVAVETIARSMRMGSVYHCNIASGTLTSPADCPSGSDSIAFKPDSSSDIYKNSDYVAFKLNGQSIERIIHKDASSQFFPLTGSDIKITGLKFYVGGNATGDKLQPVVLISIQGEAGTKAKIKSTFNLQTSVTQRALDQ